MLAPHGHTLADLLATLDLSSATSGADTVLAPVSRVEALLARSGELTQTPSFGLALAERLPIGSFSLLEFAVRSAPTLGHALQVLVEHRGELNPAVVYTLTRQRRAAVLEITVPGRAVGLGPHLNEYSLAIVLRQARAVTGSPLRPERAAFAHARPTSPGAPERALETTVTYGALACRLELSADALGLPLRYRDDALHGYLLDTLRSRALPSTEERLAHRVSAHLARVLGDGSSSPKEVAAAFAMSPRTLQRRLELEGESFSALLDQARRVRAESYLANPSLEAGDLVKLLDMGSTRTFRRACARWFGPESQGIRRSHA